MSEDYTLFLVIQKIAQIKEELDYQAGVMEFVSDETIAQLEILEEVFTEATKEQDDE